MKGLLFVIFALIATISFAAEPIFINNYEEALKSEEPVLVIFGTEWCGNCVKLKREIKDINLDDYVVCVLDAEIEDKLSSQYKIKAYPTSVVIKKGKEVSRKIGYRKFEFERWINQNR